MEMNRKKRFLLAVIGGTPLGFLALLYYGVPVLPAVIIALVLGGIVALAFVWEIRAEKNDAAFRQAVESGERYAQDEWREAYAKYRGTHDFQRVTAKSMQADLNRRYRKTAGIVLTGISLLFFIPAVFWRSGAAEANVFLAIGGLIFLSWGLLKLLRTPVRAFCRACGENLPHIDRSYLNGKLLSYRKGDIRSGICIDGDYTVIWDAKRITAVENSRVTEARKHIRRTKYYGNGVYTGSRTDYFLIVDYDDAAGSGHRCSAQLNEFQVEMALEAMNAARSSVGFSMKEQNDYVF
ncbi:MAG: hypothetical protein IJ060_05880 [Oscillospiraceae bacterium]|nr:hypothetical protein [Oscillospiraceae bacterium]